LIGDTGGLSQGKLSIASLVTLKPIDLLKSLRFTITCCSAEAIASDSLFTGHSPRGVKSYNQTEVSSWPTWKNSKL
jgi:hypothetical protein